MQNDFGATVLLVVTRKQSKAVVKCNSWDYWRIARLDLSNQHEYLTRWLLVKRNVTPIKRDRMNWRKSAATIHSCISLAHAISPCPSALHLPIKPRHPLSLFGLLIFALLVIWAVFTHVDEHCGHGISLWLVYNIKFITRQESPHHDHILALIPILCSYIHDTLNL